MRDWRDARIGNGLAVAAILLAAAQLARPLYAPTLAHAPYDLIHFWRAGVMWLDGASPYDPGYAVFDPAYRTVPTADEYNVRPFFYPPAARVLFEPLALFSFAGARSFLTLVSLILWGGVCRFLAAAMPGSSAAPMLRRTAMVAVGLAFCLPQMRLATEFGQVTAWVVAAITGVLAARRCAPGLASDLFLAACVFVLMLKPPLGLAVCLVLALRRERWRALAIATAAVALATLYGATGDLVGTLSAYLANGAAYDGFWENNLLWTSSLSVLLVGLGLPAPGGVALAGAVVLSGAALGLARRLSTPDALFAATVASLLLMPSHSYDYLVLVPFLPQLARARGAALRLVAIGGLCVAYGQPAQLSAQTFSFLTGRNAEAVGYLFGAPRFETIGIVLFGAGAALLLARGRGAPVADSPSEFLVERADLRMLPQHLLQRAEHLVPRGLRRRALHDDH